MKTTQTQISAFVVAVINHEKKGAALMATLQALITESGNVVEFRAALYKTAKAKSETAYTAIRKAFSRVTKAMGLETGENRGKAKTGAKLAKAAAKTKTPLPDTKVSGMTNADALTRVALLGAQFLTAEDQVIMARLVAAISHKLKTATTSKK